MKRERMEFDVVVVGAGPAGLTAAIKLAQLSKEHQLSLSICVLDKASEIGGHIVSGSLVESRALDELLPNWHQADAVNAVHANTEALVYLHNQNRCTAVPNCFTPPSLKNPNSYLLSLSSLCRWLGEQAESLGVNVFAGFAAQDLLWGESQRVDGIITKDIGVNEKGEHKPNFQAGLELAAKYTIFSEGCRGHLGKKLIEHFALDKGCTAQHYALGIKEVWQLPEDATEFNEGSILHTIGWPLNESGTTGGGFLYHMANHQVSLGLIVDLSYHNTYLDPFMEFQKFKHHPIIARLLSQGERIAFGARAITKGGLYSLPKQSFPGGVVVGCDAGTLNPAKIKGVHCAIKSACLAAESIVEALKSDEQCDTPDYDKHFKNSWLYRELKQSQNFTGTIHKFGTLFGGALNFAEQRLLPLLPNGEPIWSIKAPKADYLHLRGKDRCHPIHYGKPDGVLSFDRPSSLYLSATQHVEDQPNHLHLTDHQLPISTHLSFFDEPSQRYCPAGVYEVIDKDNNPRFQINSANCLHCKTCDIKDPSQNIEWTPPESGGGPNYRNT
ncbi:electron transfer flavoprotein-ubiquinone oxidoreductase [Vibrio sonorensis]|uniref:electron transfer flavoprotein-ubiquinone oxidoreductase n=1 Tax=Vibrio sonorensis TaxID=1004316 RepID=UPI0008D9EBAB|nr:electron transfer flavoprotein-ubiquinone oxidoreductase [Vibrio sonorensis]